MKVVSVVIVVCCFDDSSGGLLCLGEGREVCRYLVVDVEWVGYFSNSGFILMGLFYRCGL